MYQIITDAASLRRYAALLPKDHGDVRRVLESWFSTHPGALDYRACAAWVEHVSGVSDRGLQAAAAALRAAADAPPLSPAERDELARAAQLRVAAADAAALYGAVAEGAEPPDADTLRAASENVASALRTSARVEAPDAWDVAQTSTRTHGGLDWRLPQLRAAVFPLGLGDLAMIAAPPEVGKTLFAISEAAHMLPQLASDKTLLYVALEEAPWKTAERLISATLGTPYSEVRRRPDAARVAFAARTGGRVRVVGHEAAHMAALEQIAHDTRAGLIVVDQLHCVVGFRGERGSVDYLQQQFEYARRLAQTVAPVIAVHQAPPIRLDGRPKLYLDLDDCYGSRVAIQGSIDVGIMFNASGEAGYEWQRYVHVCKNKSPIDPLLPHPKFEVRLDPARSRAEAV